MAWVRILSLVVIGIACLATAPVSADPPEVLQARIQRPLLPAAYWPGPKGDSWYYWFVKDDQGHVISLYFDWHAVPILNEETGRSIDITEAIGLTKGTRLQILGHWGENETSFVPTAIIIVDPSFEVSPKTGKAM